MTKLVRKMQAEIDKNLKQIEEVPTLSINILLCI